MKIQPIEGVEITAVKQDGREVTFTTAIPVFEVNNWATCCAYLYTSEKPKAIHFTCKLLDCSLKEATYFVEDAFFSYDFSGGLQTKEEEFTQLPISLGDFLNYQHRED
mgnify:CR=1 FL=1